MNFEEIIGDVFSTNSEEFQIIKDTYDLIGMSAPTIAAEFKTHMILLDKYKISLSTMYYMLSRNISEKKEAFSATYNSSYVRLVKLGRPSAAAIEAEIKAGNPAYSGMTHEIEKLQQVKDLINDYLRCIDSCKQTAIEFLRDSRRID